MPRTATRRFAHAAHAMWWMKVAAASGAMLVLIPARMEATAPSAVFSPAQRRNEGRMKKPVEIKARGRGKTFHRSADAAKRRIVDTHEFLLKRHGGWFRPGAHGYTDDLSQAGVFCGKDAKSYLTCEGVSLFPLMGMVPIIAKASREHIQKAANLAKMIENY